VEARVIGVAPEVDLALLKVDLTGLPAFPLADYARWSATSASRSWALAMRSGLMRAT